jgi:prephenate dehydratase
LNGKFTFCIESEIVLNIKQNLLGSGKLSDVKMVYSRSEALNQCRKFLEKHHLQTQAMDSTSAAVRFVAEKARDNFKLAAIGTKRAAEIYKLPIIAKNIGDNENNKTRFIVLGRKMSKITGKDKTSLIFGTRNKPGTLLRALEVFDALIINMTTIHSRPSKTKLGEYIFFIDIEGHQEDPRIKIALDILKNKVSFLKILGSYPTI